MYSLQLCQTLLTVADKPPILARTADQRSERGKVFGGNRCASPRLGWA
jgi:hypothetical protein